MAQVRKPEMRRRIEQAALEQFAERGYAGASIASIAAAAGTAPANVYRYVADKADLFAQVVPHALVERHDELLDRRIASLGAAAGAGAGTGTGRRACACSRRSTRSVARADRDARARCAGSEPRTGTGTGSSAASGSATHAGTCAGTGASQGRTQGAAARGRRRHHGLRCRQRVARWRCRTWRCWAVGLPAVRTASQGRCPDRHDANAGASRSHGES